MKALRVLTGSSFEVPAQEEHVWNSKTIFWTQSRFPESLSLRSPGVVSLKLKGFSSKNWISCLAGPFNLGPTYSLNSDDPEEFAAVVIGEESMVFERTSLALVAGPALSVGLRWSLMFFPFGIFGCKFGSPPRSIGRWRSSEAAVVIENELLITSGALRREIDSPMDSAQDVFFPPTVLVWFPNTVREAFVRKAISPWPDVANCLLPPPASRLVKTVEPGSRIVEIEWPAFAILFALPFLADMVNVFLLCSAESSGLFAMTSFCAGVIKRKARCQP